jgi:hypothetical protein
LPAVSLYLLLIEKTNVASYDAWLKGWLLSLYQRIVFRTRINVRPLFFSGLMPKHHYDSLFNYDYSYFSGAAAVFISVL